MKILESVNEAIARALITGFDGLKSKSDAILVSAEKHRIEAILTLTVIGGLITGYHYGHPEIDGYIGILASLWLIYLAFTHGRHALVPILGKAPSREMIRNIRGNSPSGGRD
jgi:divalent metal cation (Fe/Co/Zn/Cd) transporter